MLPNAIPNMASRVIITVAVWICNLFSEILATCNKPTLNSNSYTLTNAESSYAVNETYEIYCNPGYIASGEGLLVCDSNNQWSLSPPECSPSEGTYPWWMLLVAVTLVILLVSCILPRFLQCCISKTKGPKGGDVESNDNGQNDGYYDDDDDDDDGYGGRSNSPVPDWSKQKGKMSNIEFMSKLHKDVDKKSLKRANKNAVF